MRKSTSMFLVIALLLLFGVEAYFHSGFAVAKVRIAKTSFSPSDISQENFNQVFIKDYPKTPAFKTTEIDYLDEFTTAYGLDESEKEKLLSQGMVVSERLSASSYGTFFYDVYHNELPVLITTDAILFALHTSYDTLLSDMESTLLGPSLVYMLERMHGALQDNFDNYIGMGIRKKHLKDIDLLLSVARFLMLRKEDWSENYKRHVNPEFAALHKELLSEVVFDHNRKRVTGVISQIIGSRQEQIQLFKTVRWWNFGDFEPMGHYRESEFLKGYWQAMTWLRLADFDLSQERHRIDALVLIDLLKCVKPHYDQVESVIDLLVGKTDRLTLNELDQMTDDMKLHTLRDRVKNQASIWESIQKFNLRRESISRRITYGTTSPAGKNILPFSTGMFGSRFCLDSYLIHRVTHDRIVHEGKKIERMLPNGLDVVFMMGNDRAATLLADELNRYPYHQYLAGLRSSVDNLDGQFWNKSYYNLWLGALKGLNASQNDPRYPQVMRTASWQDKVINTQLIGLTQVRHANQLYNPPVYCGTICEFPHVYVEPYPEFYLRLRQLAEKWLDLTGLFIQPPETRYLKSSTVKTLPGRFKALQQAAGEIFLRWEETMRVLELVAENELNGNELTSKQAVFLKDIMEVGIYRTSGSGAVTFPMYSGWYPGLFYGNKGRCQLFNPLVVAAAYDVFNPRYLEMATGLINGCLVVLDVNGKPTLFVGPVGSYYEFIHPGNVPQTDEEWRKQVARTDYDPDRRSGWSKPYWTGDYNNRSSKVERPVWTTSFLAESDNLEFLSCTYDRVVAYLPDHIALLAGLNESVQALILDATGEDSPNFHCAYFETGPFSLVMPKGTQEGSIELDVEVKNGKVISTSVNKCTDIQFEQLSRNILNNILFLKGLRSRGNWTLKPIESEMKSERHRKTIEHNHKLYSLEYEVPVEKGKFKLKIRFGRAIPRYESP